jgi:hypothetical protein
MIFHDEPLKTPSLNAVLDGDIEIIYFPPSAKLQTCAANKLMLPQPSRADNDRGTSRVRNGGESQEKPRIDVRKWKLAE